MPKVEEEGMLDVGTSVAGGDGSQPSSLLLPQQLNLIAQQRFG
jgi:hypothetical protein